MATKRAGCPPPGAGNAARGACATSQPPVSVSAVLLLSTLRGLLSMM